MALIKCKECRKEISDKAKKCPHCGSPITKVTFGGIMGLIFVSVFMFAIVKGSYMGASSPSRQESKPASTPSQGNSCYGLIGKEINLPKYKSPVAVDEDSLGQYMKYLRADDKQGERNLFLSGRMFGVDGNTKVKVISCKDWLAEIRILEGEHSGFSGWVPQEEIGAK